MRVRFTFPDIRNVDAKTKDVELVYLTDFALSDASVERADLIELLDDQDNVLRVLKNRHGPRS